MVRGGGSINHTPSGTVESLEAAHTHNYGIQYGGYFRDTIFEKNSNAGVIDYDATNNFSISTETKASTYTVDANGGNTQSAIAREGTQHYRHIGHTSYTAPAITSTFTGTPQDTMPPYLAVYCWKRTA